jgi:hypothetical protein
VLHTHSRRLDYHPHVHVVMPAAAIDTDKRLWRTKKGSVALTTKTDIPGEQECQSFKLGGFILPVRKIVLQKTFYFLPQ